MATAERWTEQRATQDAWRGLTLYGVDGTTLHVPDTEENRAHFGGPTTHRGPCGYPILRLVALIALRSHLMRAAAFGPYEQDELRYAESSWDAVPDDSLVLLDRKYFSALVFHRFLGSEKRRHCLVRVKSSLKATVKKRLGQRDDLVELVVTDYARKKDPTLPKTLQLRRLVMHKKGYRPWVLLTTLLDPIKYPSQELGELYHERWEQELGYDEIKNQLLEQKETLRSRSPQLVEQEVWGILLAYNLVRLEMTRLAKLAGVSPVQLSFSGTLMMLLQLWQTLPSRYPGTIPRMLRTFEAQIQRLLLPPRRTQRRYPRAVKVKMSNYSRKRPISDGRGA